jgi:hypothetical protein
VSDPNLNLFGDSTRLSPLPVSTENPNAFNQVMDEKDGLVKLLDCSQFDPSVNSAKKFVVQPGQEVSEPLDRAEAHGMWDRRRLSAAEDRVTRLYPIPMSAVFNSPKTLDIDLYLGPQESRNPGQAMTISRPLFWYQGLFLQPQHLQLLERSLQTLLVPFQGIPPATPLGRVGDGDSKAALGIRSFALGKGTFLFPDGTFAVLPGNALVEGRTFDQAWVEGGKPFQVHVGVRKWNEAGENVTVLTKLENLADVTTRFVSRADPEDVQDLHSGGPVGQVKRLHYVLRIFWESERDQLGDYVLLPIAQLERMGEEIRSERSPPRSIPGRSPAEADTGGANQSPPRPPVGGAQRSGIQT